MSPRDCRVRSVRLRAGNEALVHRGAILLEDALRTASIPGGDGAGVLVVRSLDLGVVRSSGSAAAVAINVEERLRTAVVSAVRADDPGAAWAPAVRFADAVEPYVLLVLRLASGRPATEWFWPAVMPAWRPDLTSAERIRTLLYEVQEGEAGVLGAACVLESLARAGTAGTLLDAMASEDGAALLAKSGWEAPGRADGGISLAVPRGAPELPARLAEEPCVRQALARWGAADARTLWLASVLLVSRAPWRGGDPRLPARVAEFLQAVVSSGAPAEPSEPPLGLIEPAASRSAAPADGLGLRPQATRRIARPWTLPEGAVASEYAGFFFLLPLLARLGIDALLGTEGDPPARAFPLALLRRLLRLVGVPEEDGVALALSAAEAQPSTPDPPAEERARLAAWIRGARRWSAETAGLTLRRLVSRPGLIAAAPTHVDVFLDGRTIDLRIRRAGLDVDPGWVWWLGRVVLFHYDVELEYVE
jgi:hypothetical protein